MSSPRKRSAVVKANRETERLRQSLMLAEHQCNIYEGFAKILAAKCDELQAKIDSLMLEFCPEEMSEDQIKNWKNNQGVVG